MGKVRLHFYITVSSCFMQCLQFDIYVQFAVCHVSRKNSHKDMTSASFLILVILSFHLLSLRECRMSEFS